MDPSTIQEINNEPQPVLDKVEKEEEDCVLQRGEAHECGASTLGNTNMDEQKSIVEEPTTAPTTRTTGNCALQHSEAHECGASSLRSTNFNYCCPSCGGMFGSWDHDIPEVATSADDTGPKRCPFCHTVAGEFGEESDLAEENERLRIDLEAAEEQIVQLQEALEEVSDAID